MNLGEGTIQSLTVYYIQYIIDYTQDALNLGLYMKSNLLRDQQTEN